ncbi:hypothetical protein ROZALSC1DRAFT_29991 [Rozella allomycis CSF55]|uniref:DUF625 domain-containing protein n=1 Tax=Rozella allomycis (strain CSF55) TaxID=988480 RepID=A0A075B1W1_ROZAC|nr:DUF625 domain-containing protein [Rozella allomycis CSF55]RKP18304.1 hypothetical protein ROZALSC1DRAFT_29991 [Rozella allomycis CSF55]|eukprot:EPZ36355.1 DUF625 domain-containing protein [Rozella allomycis CSF55]
MDANERGDEIVVMVFEFVEAESAWKSLGVGKLQFFQNNDQTETALCVTNEKDESECLLDHTIRPEENYSRTEENSESIEQAQQMSTADYMIVDVEDGKRISVELPEPTLKNVESLKEIFKQTNVSGRVKWTLYQQIMRNNYLETLFELFETCEDLEATEELEKFYFIFRGIVNLLFNSNTMDLLKKIVSRENVLNFVDDPEYMHCKPKYREYLKSEDLYRNVFFIENKEIEELIHQSFRAQYLKDVVLTRVLEDEGFNCIMRFIRSVNYEIINYLMSEESNIFIQINDLLERREKRREILSFLKEFNLMVKMTEFSNLFQKEAIKILNPILKIFKEEKEDQSEKEKENFDLRSKAAEFILGIIEQNPDNVRSAILDQENEKNNLNLLKIILDSFLDEKDSGLRLEFLEIIRSLLTFPPNPSEKIKSDLLNLFYQSFVESFFFPLSNLSNDSEIKDPEIIQHLIDLLCGFIRQHTYNIKYFILGSSVSQGIISLCNSNFPHLKICKFRKLYFHLAAIKYLKTCIQRRDQFFDRFIIKNDLVKKVIELAVEYQNQDNLISATILDCLNTISCSNLLSLHLLEKYRQTIESLSNPNFTNLIKLYENGVNENNKNNPNVPAKGLWTSDADEDAYFNSDDDPIHKRNTSSPPPLDALPPLKPSSPTLDDPDFSLNTFVPLKRKSNEENEDLNFTKPKIKKSEPIKFKFREIS